MILFFLDALNSICKRYIFCVRVSVKHYFILIALIKSLENLPRNSLSYSAHGTLSNVALWGRVTMSPMQSVKREQLESSSKFIAQFFIAWIYILSTFKNSEISMLCILKLFSFLQELQPSLQNCDQYIESQTHKFLFTDAMIHVTC